MRKFSVFVFSIPLALQLVGCSHSSDSSTDSKSEKKLVVTPTPLPYPVNPYEIPKGLPTPPPLPQPGDFPNPKMTPKPAATSTPAVSDGTSCFKPTAVQGAEITLDQLITGVPGHYRLTTSNTTLLFSKGDLKASMSATSSTIKNSNSLSSTSGMLCDDLGSIQGLKLTVRFSSPVMISRESGAISNSLDTSGSLSGEIAEDSEKLTSSIGNFSVSSLQGLVVKMLQSKSPVRLFQIQPEIFRLITTQKLEQDGQSFQTVTVATYVFEPEAPRPLPTPFPPPAPTPTPVPTPMPSEGEKIQTQLAELCDQYYDVGEKTRCLVSFKKSSPPLNIFPICKQYYDVGEKVRCVRNLADVRLPDGVVSICSLYYDVGEKVRCLKSLDGIRISPEALKICVGYYDVGEKIRCIKQVGDQ